MGGLGLYSHNSITGITLLLSLVGDPSKFAIQQHASPWWFLPIEVVASHVTFWLLQAIGNPKVKNFVRLCKFEGFWCMGGGTAITA